MLYEFIAIEIIIFLFIYAYFTCIILIFFSLLQYDKYPKLESSLYRRPSVTIIFYSLTKKSCEYIMFIQCCQSYIFFFQVKYVLNLKNHFIKCVFFLYGTYLFSISFIKYKFQFKICLCDLKKKCLLDMFLVYDNFFLLCFYLNLFHFFTFLACMLLLICFC